MKRIALVTLASLIGLGIIVLIGELTRPDEGRDPQQVRPVEDEQLPGTPSFEQRPSTTAEAPRPGQMNKAIVERADPDTGELSQRFEWVRLDPLSEGQFDVRQPEAWFFLDEQRLLQMRADEGFFIMRTDFPENGRFSKNVRITWYDAPQTRPATAQPAGSVPVDPRVKDRSILMRLFIGNQRGEGTANFDTTLGKIDSISPVFITSPSMDFAGDGMILQYNEPQSRIDYLQITEGRYLLFNPDVPLGPDAQWRGEDDAPQPENPDEDATPSPQPDTTQNDVDTETTDTGVTESEPAATQYYRITFDQGVFVTSEGRSITASQMKIWFAMEEDRQAEQSQTPQAMTPANIQPMLAPVGPMLAMALGQMGGETSDAPVQADHDFLSATEDPQTWADADQRSIRLAGPDDVYLTWTGKMVLVPEAERPEQMQDDRDVLVIFEGDPVIVRNEFSEQIVCDRLQYNRLNEYAQLYGSPQQQVVITSPRFGTVHAEQLSARLDQNIGTFVGRGVMRTFAADDARAAGISDGTPPDFTVAWSQSARFEFADQTGDSPGLREARFVGDVHARDPRIDLHSGAMLVHFEPVEDSSPQLLDLLASESVRVVSEDQQITADQLAIDTHIIDGRRTPHRMTARGNVLLSQPDQTLAAEHLEADLVRQAAQGWMPGTQSATQAAQPDNALGEGAVREVRARGSVVLKNLNEASTIHAETLVADAQQRTAELTGSPVRLIRTNAEMRVAKLHVNQDEQTVHATGEGELRLREQLDMHPDAVRVVRVRWNESMRFVDAENQIEVRGDVIAESSDDPREMNRIQADRMTLRLVPTELRSEAARRDPADPNQPAMASLTDQPRALQHLHARGDVTLLTSEWADRARRNLIRRLRITGKVLEFDNIIEKLTVTGQGSMLVEDYREEQGEPAANNDAIAISGRGATFFTWTQIMSLDAPRGLMLMRGQVQMLHRPQNAGNSQMELQCHRLTAALEPDRNMRLLDTNQTASTRINQIDARGNVHLSDGQRVIVCNRMLYRRAEDQINLESLAGKPIQIIRVNEPKALLAESVIWHLGADRLEIEKGRY